MSDPIPVELIRAAALAVCREVYGTEGAACTEPCDVCFEEAEYFLQRGRDGHD